MKHGRNEELTLLFIYIFSSRLCCCCCCCFYNFFLRLLLVQILQILFYYYYDFFGFLLTQNYEFVQGCECNNGMILSKVNWLIRIEFTKVGSQSCVFNTLNCIVYYSMLRDWCLFIIIIIIIIITSLFSSRFLGIGGLKNRENYKRNPLFCKLVVIIQWD